MNADPADRLGMQLKLFRSRPAQRYSGRSLARQLTRACCNYHRGRSRKAADIGCASTLHEKGCKPQRNQNVRKQ